MRIGLLPLDERPVNTRYPAMIAAIAGAELRLPPPALLSERHRPADCAALARWLADEAPGLDALIVSLEQLGHGGLIASRTTHEPAAAILARLELLRELRRLHPRLTIYGFSVITRVSDADDAVEEPAYWASYGQRFYALAQLLDRRRQGQPVDAAIAELEAAIPPQHRRDFLARRLRNHAVNLAALGLLEDGTLDLLVLSSDDTSPFGLPSAEKAWLAHWAQLLGAQRLLMYPGADEVGCALVARLLNAAAGVMPAVVVRYAPPAGAANVAAYEDGPISRTVERQIVACGGRLVADDAPPATRPDIWLGVNAPFARRAEWAPEHAATERAERAEALAALLAEAQTQLAAGVPVALADVAYPNGADPALVERLRAGVDLTRLAAFGAWNTAGNTVGTVLAHACAVRLIATPAGRAAHERFLLHRLLEDWGYQGRVRAEARAWLRETTGYHDPRTPATLALATDVVARGLDATLRELPAFAGRYRIAAGSVRLPWGRTFEVDFDLEQVEHKPERG